MVSHIFMLSVIQVARSILGLLLGAFLIYRSFQIPPERIHRLETGDRLAFRLAGTVCLALALARGSQGWITARLVRAARRHGTGPGRTRGRLARRLGLVLFSFDLLDLVVFPVSTACGTYGILVYRHPDSRDFFEGVFSQRAASVPAAAPAR